MLPTASTSRQGRVTASAVCQKTPEKGAYNIPHVVNLVVDDPSHLSHHLTPPVKHRSQDFRGHDQARGAGVDGDVARHQADVTELLLRNVQVDRHTR